MFALSAFPDVAKPYPMSSLSEAALDAIDEEEFRGRIPSDFQDSFIQGLLDAKLCICARSLEKGGEAWNAVEALLTQGGRKDVTDIALKIKATADRYSRSIAKARSEVGFHEDRVRSLDKEWNAANTDIEELNARLRGTELDVLAEKARKRENLEEKMGNVTMRTLIYCGEGRAQSDDSDNSDDAVDVEDLQNIDIVTRMVSNRGYRVARFTSQESPNERREILSMFRTGNIEILTAIRCLDEGMNIPACETAFILASSANPRQFIQRRGRILRRSPGKLSAMLWDFLPLPPKSSVSEEHEKQILRKELGRISEFSRHSMNFMDTYRVLSPLLQRYDLGADFLLGDAS